MVKIAGLEMCVGWDGKREPPKVAVHLDEGKTHLNFCGLACSQPSKIKSSRADPLLPDCCPLAVCCPGDPVTGLIQFVFTPPCFFLFLILKALDVQEHLGKNSGAVPDACCAVGEQPPPAGSCTSRMGFGLTGLLGLGVCNNYVCWQLRVEANLV